MSFRWVGARAISRLFAGGWVVSRFKIGVCHYWRVTKLTLLDELFRSYSFKELVDLVINKLGFSALIVLFGAHFAAIVYFSALPSKGRFSTDFPRSNVVGFFQQAFYVFSFIIFLTPFISGWGSFFLVLLLYGIIIVPMLVNTHVLGRDFTFDEYLKFRSGGFMSMIWKYSGIALSWVVMLAELLAFSYCDPTIPLVGWAVILYSLAAAFLQAALGQSILGNACSCVYAKITTVDGIVEGFIVAKGSDHYLVKTRENGVLLSNEYVKSISPSGLPK